MDKAINADARQVPRLAADLDRIVVPGERIGVAVSGGPDSLALLLLAAAARPGQVEAATVDHALRPESRSEAGMVAGVCRRLGVPHTILTAKWDKPPHTAIQERARAERYRLLAQWAEQRGLAAILTAHQADDQAETLLMRLNRGAGVRGLVGMRPVSAVGDVRLVRPLLGWRRAELEQVCADAGVEAVRDPSNEDEKFERVRIRKAIAGGGWLDAEALARSAANLAAADTALDWAVDAEWERGITSSRAAFAYAPAAPSEIQRRILARIIASLATEGSDEPLRGRELDRLLETLASGGTATLRGVLCSGGEEWRFSRAPERRSR